MLTRVKPGAFIAIMKKLRLTAMPQALIADMHYLCKSAHATSSQGTFVRNNEG